MAVEARLPTLLLRYAAASADYLAAVVDGARMELHHVARLAEIRGLELQERVIVGPVRVMAVRAVLPYGRVLPEERPPLLGVALVAGLVYRGCLQEARPGPSVRVVAARAVHEPLTQRHVRRTLELRPPLPVALETGHLRVLVYGGGFRRPPLHDVMALGAGDVGHVVGAAPPVHPYALLVALEADPVLPLSADGAVLEREDGALHRLHYVASRGAVARLAVVRAPLP